MNAPVVPLVPRKSPPRIVVAIPVKNEEERIGACLGALAAQRAAPPFELVLLLNDCTDGTAALLRALAPSCPLPLHIVERSLPAARAHAGEARRLACRHAARLCGPDGVLLTTDADSRAPPGWVAANLRALRRGADAVAGRAEIDPEEATLIPARLHEDDARECAYAALLDQIHALLDPDPADPWPRHDQHSGASIAVTADAYRRAGGMPGLPIGEDRAFFEALRRTEARIRHAPEVWVEVSGRTVGRATGGMADTMRRRIDAPDELLDDRLEPVADAVRRGRLRAAVRSACRGVPPRGGAKRLAESLALPARQIAALIEAGRFGLAWSKMEAASPVLQRRRVPVTELPYQTARARDIRDALAREQTLSRAASAGPAGIAVRAAPR
ncbi:MAG: glycosyltransferase [Acidisphaera sp.]|nr:glycosyltransferase [Acidisphaera sp.]